MGGYQRNGFVGVASLETGGKKIRIEVNINEMKFICRSSLPCNRWGKKKNHAGILLTTENVAFMYMGRRSVCLSTFPLNDLSKTTGLINEFGRTHL